MKRLFVILLASLLFSSVSLAGGIPADISGEGYDCMYYQCALPDGRVILAGWKSTPGNWQDSRARILCLNPDMSVCWEYLDPAEGCCGFVKAAALENGMLGAVFENAPDQSLAERKLKFFTPDGTPAGEEIDLTIPGSLIDGAAASCLWVSGVESTQFVDWDGNVIFQFADGQNPLGGCDRMTGTEDGLVFAGRTTGEDAALLMKLDLQGGILWSSRIPASELPGVEGANLTDCIRTEDGGYLAQLVEYGTEISAYRYLVRFDAGGRLLWKTGEPFERCPDTWLNGLCMHNGRIVAELLGKGNEYGMNAVCTYVWMDGEGNWLGTTEYDTKDLELPREEGRNTQISPYALISTGEGLWGLCSVETEDDDNEKRLDGVNDFLVRIPEL